MPSIEDLPFEILSEILRIAVELNARDTPSYTYGLTQTDKTLQRVQTQIYVRGRTTPDVFRWDSASPLRLVNSRWHEWALSYAMKEIYIRRWRGGERWLYKSSREEIRSSAAAGVFPVVYQHPYTAATSTVMLLHDYPLIAKHVRRIWFNGIYQFDMSNAIFDALRHCTNLRTLTLPWTALRYGTGADWQAILSFPQLTSLEFLAVGMSLSQMQRATNHVDHAVLRKTHLDFSALKRLKIFGDSNLMPISDTDLLSIATTATNLEEIHVTGSTSITINGIAAVVSASRNTLKVLEYKPPAGPGFHDGPAEECPHHICSLIASCPHLEDLTITVPSCCPDLFSTGAAANWRETARIRITGGVCRCSREQSMVDSAVDEFVKLLDSAGVLLTSDENRQLDVEIAVGAYLFDVRSGLVHGDFSGAKKASEGMWRPEEAVSLRGPYGSTGVYGGDGKGGWICIPLGEFLEGVRWGLVRFWE